MTSEELRRKYIDFFRSKGHATVPSASLIPENDPSVLFTTAGMHPLVPYLLGETHPAGKRLVSVQKCIRTGDIDEVGDNRHLTFFEMLGNWSLGDYFKKDAIAWSFEFLTSQEWLGLDPRRLYVSVFAGDSDAPKDEEAIGYWQAAFRSADIEATEGSSERGVAGTDRIFPYGKDKNWWGPAGETGPCGPDTEMFYDTLHLDDRSAHAPGWAETRPGRVERCHPNCDCGRYVEIWNDVFMQYSKTKAGIFEPLAQRNVDTGMGLERTVSVVNGTDLFEIDTFAPILRSIEALTGKRYADDGDLARAMRIVADHVRSAVFILGDERGILPSNTGQGYILRRLIRRAVRYGRILGRTEPFQALIAESIIEAFGPTYPELRTNRVAVLEALTAEEQKFAAAIDRGLREFSRLPGVDGKIAFDLYQSYGFPLELTEELARERGFKIDRETFAAEFRKHQELSRTASAGQFKGGLTDHSGAVVRLHTATHLMNAALRQVLGDHVWQKGSNITAERTRFDFSHDKKLSDGEKAKVEELVNGWILRDLTVEKKILPLEEARKLGAIGVFGEKYPDTVSVYTVMDPKTEEIVSREFCGGPHVTHTGEIGRFRILKEEASSAGVRRIKATVGG